MTDAPPANPYEVGTVLTGAILLGAILGDDPVVRWMQANLGKLALGGVLGGFVGLCLVLLSSDVTAKVAAGRVMASAILGLVVVACTGAVQANGEGLAATVIAILVVAIGAPFILVSAADFFKELKESRRLQAAFMGVWDRWYARFNPPPSAGQVTPQTLPDIMPDVQVIPIGKDVAILTPKPNSDSGSKVKLVPPPEEGGRVGPKPPAR